MYDTYTYMVNGKKHSIFIKDNNTLPVQIHKEHTYLDMLQMDAALHRLTPEAFMLYSYFALKPPNYIWAVSTHNFEYMKPEDFECGFAELVSAGYIDCGAIKLHDGENYSEIERGYHFYEIPSRRSGNEHDND